MMSQLQAVLTIRELRLELVRAELAQRLAELAAVDVELRAAADEVARVAGQRVLWEHEWQRWLHQDGVLRHGQDYNLSHVALSAWEQDAKATYDEIAAKREQAAAVANEVRQRLAKAQQRCDVMKEELHRLRRVEASRRAALLDSRSQDDAAGRLSLTLGSSIRTAV
jgi:hypothetical protein